MVRVLCQKTSNVNALSVTVDSVGWIEFFRNLMLGIVTSRNDPTDVDERHVAFDSMYLLAYYLYEHENPTENENFAAECLVTFLLERQKPENEGPAVPVDLERVRNTITNCDDLLESHWSREGGDLVVTRDYVNCIPVGDLPPNMTSDEQLQRMAKIGSHIDAVATLEKSCNYVKLYEMIAEQLFNKCEVFDIKSLFDRLLWIMGINLIVGKRKRPLHLKGVNAFSQLRDVADIWNCKSDEEFKQVVQTTVDLYDVLLLKNIYNNRNRTVKDIVKRFTEGLDAFNERYKARSKARMEVAAEANIGGRGETAGADRHTNRRERIRQLELQDIASLSETIRTFRKAVADMQQPAVR